MENQIITPPRILSCPRFILLTDDEVLESAIDGCRRLIETHLHNNRPDRNGPVVGPNERWGIDINSALAERALTKILGLPWSGKGSIDKADIGTKTQVRSTHWDSGCLQVDKDDPDNHLFFLVTGQLNKWTVRGFLYGHEAKKIGTFKAKREGFKPKYYVEQQYLTKEINLSRYIA